MELATAACNQAMTQLKELRVQQIQSSQAYHQNQVQPVGANQRQGSFHVSPFPPEWQSMNHEVNIASRIYRVANIKRALNNFATVHFTATKLWANLVYFI